MANESLHFIEEAEFTKNVYRHLSEIQFQALLLYLTDNPRKGDVIPGTDGCRKLRWGAEGRGKRGGTRVIYYFRDRQGIIHLLMIYAKNEDENVSTKEILNLRKRIQDD